MLWNHDQMMHNFNFFCLSNVYPRDRDDDVYVLWLVIEGVCRSRNALLNGDTSNYDWDNGYTCHQVSTNIQILKRGILLTDTCF